MAGVAACGNVFQRGLVRAVGGAAAQHETPIAIAAIDITVLVDLKPHARVAERRCAIAVAGANRIGTVAFDANVIDQSRFGRRNVHGAQIMRCAHLRNWPFTDRLQGAN